MTVKLRDTQLALSLTAGQGVRANPGATDIEAFTPANSVHTHPESDITNLVSDLAGKSAVGHTHPESDITSLVSDLAGKAASVHVHAGADITTGTVATARLGSGGADGTTFLRGDQTWAAPTAGDLDSVLTGSSTISANKVRTIGGRLTINDGGGRLTINDGGRLSLV